MIGILNITVVLGCHWLNLGPFALLPIQDRTP